MEKEYKLAEYFRNLLYNNTHNSYTAAMYFHLFSFKENKILQEDIEHLYTLYKGTDNFFKESSIGDWFAIWHKSIRQTDYFEDCYQKRKVELVTKDERKEFKHLAHICNNKEFSKVEGKNEKQLFNPTYNRYLELHSLVSRESKEVCICGHLDSILWNLVNEDTNILRDCFIEVFKFLEINENEL